jgi:hypothetical protein
MKKELSLRYSLVVYIIVYRLVRIQDKRYFSEADIDLMINNYNIQYNQAQQSVYKAGGAGPQRQGNNINVQQVVSGPTPFNKP